MLVILGAAPTVRADEQPVPQELYRRALQELRAGDFSKARLDFEAYVASYPASPVYSAALLGAAKASVYDGQYDAAIGYAERYLESGQTGGATLAHLYRGHAHLARRSVEEALLDYDAGHGATDNAVLRALFLAVTYTAVERLPLELAVKLLDADLQVEMAAVVFNSVAARMERSGQRYQAAQTYGRLAERYPGSPEGNLAAGRQREVDRQLAQTARIAVLMPISGPLSEYGAELQSGIQLAAKEFTDSTGRQIDLLLEDTESNAVLATRACQEAVKLDPLAVIGPLTSQASIGCAATTAQLSIPHVIPAATESGLPTLGEAVVCLSPSVRLYGRSLGTYAVENLGLCSHVIIAPNDDYGREVAAEYRRAVEAAGGNVWYETYYEPGATDFGPNLRTFKAGFLDTLSDTSWFYDAESKRLDNEEVTVYPDAVFTPGYATELILLLPQIRFYKIAGRILGTDSFADDELMMRAGGNLEEAVFASVQPVGTGPTEWQMFASRYTRRYGKAPGRLAGLGYDAFRLIASGLVDAQVTRGSLSKYLRSRTEFRGVTGTMRFNRRGENTSVPMYYIRDGKISPATR